MLQSLEEQPIGVNVAEAEGLKFTDLLPPHDWHPTAGTAKLELPVST
jgi:hypothetical protein